jgi:hypothetical protein
MEKLSQTQTLEKLKTKVRFTSLDVAAMVENLQAHIGMRYILHLTII